MTTSWAGLTKAVSPGEILYLADGSICLRVRGSEFDTQVRGERHISVLPQKRSLTAAKRHS
jgi:hypothetical protein